MDKYTDYLGIDVSKKTLDVMTSQQKYFQLSNDLKGFREFAKIIPRDGLCIMKVTGIYHLQLASYFGLAPTERSSGTSVNGTRKISKMGNPLVRKKLYMCSLQASMRNKSCLN